MFGNGAAKATFDWATGKVRLTETHGPAGDHAELMVVIPVLQKNMNEIPVREASLIMERLQQVIVENNHPLPVASVLPDEVTARMPSAGNVHTICKQAGYDDGRCAVATLGNETDLNVYLHLPLATWSGPVFQTEIGSTVGFTGGQWSGSFSVPQAAMDQLSMRNQSYPIVYDLDPDGNNDPNVRSGNVLCKAYVLCTTVASS